MPPQSQKKAAARKKKNAPKAPKVKAEKQAKQAKQQNSRGSKRSHKEVQFEYDNSDPEKPFPVGLKLLAKYQDTMQQVQIVERKEMETATNGKTVDDPEEFFLETHEKSGLAVVDPNVDYSKHKYIYYIHFIDWDRRMDMWVKRNKLVLSSTYAEAVEEEEQKKQKNAEKGKGKDGDGAKSGDGKAKHGSGKDAHKGKAAPSGGGNAQGHGHHGSFTEEDIKAHEEATKVKNVDIIVLGRFEMHTWYYSPFPTEYAKYSKLHFCEFCLAFFGVAAELVRHEARCPLRHPPGNEIYRSKETNVNVCMFEVDGARESIYCQNLCYIAKLFLDHKTLEYDCTPFLFYILCETTDRGCHVVGYFSKEKVSVAKYNLACILVLPCHQQKGYGKLLISISYELSKIEKKVGSPEKPISDLGKVSYMSYWTSTLVELLTSQPVSGELTVDQISRKTCMTTVDIIETLKERKILVWYRGKWTFSLSRLNQLKEQLQERQKRRIERLNKDPHLLYVAPCRAERLHWTPYHATKKARN